MAIDYGQEPKNRTSNGLANSVKLSTNNLNRNGIVAEPEAPDQHIADLSWIEVKELTWLVKVRANMDV
ncbi:hypothetical protein N7520_010870 [Penicillium odoratum]|uniref:uncharacterized protein n=1 Tax=Penicillium odoratum TaxID=1167516 RepID=UPI0025481FA9|nr:uncharacterized protein N7520_010870 [Penicillium odoratum]KAJ5745688.1 hypothetical protein N7520_010870 [Penicillium odoratum]